MQLKDMTDDELWAQVEVDGSLLFELLRRDVMRVSDSSKRLERLTRVLIVLTGVLLILTALLAAPELVSLIGWISNLIR